MTSNLRLPARRRPAALVAAALAATLTHAPRAQAQNIVADLVAKGMTATRVVNGSFGGLNSQMAFSTDRQTLYVSNYQRGIYAYDYAGGVLSNERRIWINDNPVDSGIEGSLGVAVHHDPTLDTDVLYFPEAVVFIPGFNSSGTPRIQTVRRLADNNGDGQWGGAGELNQAILNNIQVATQHQINQLQVRGDSLYVATGSQTVPGNNETAYTGNVNWIEDVTQIGPGDNAAGFDTPPGNGMGQDGYHLDRRPFTTTDPGKLRPFSTGIRNNYGLGFEGPNYEGDLWFSMNQQEAPVERRPDEVHKTFYKADHGFPKAYENQGFNFDDINNPDLDEDPSPLFDDVVDWKTDADALAAGFFAAGNSVTPTTTTNASLSGFDFVYSADPDINGMMYLTRNTGSGSLLEVNPVTGAERAIITSFGGQALDALRTPEGDLLVAAGDDIWLVTIPFASGALDTLLLVVDPDSGEAELRNASDATIHISGYSILSAAGSLKWEDGDWNSLADQGVPGVEEANVGATNLSELIPLRDDTLAIAPGESFALGDLFETAGTRDLRLEFALEQFSDLDGDYNDDGVVDAGDYAAWRDALGEATQLPNEGEGVTPGQVTAEDYDVWRANFGGVREPLGAIPRAGVVRYETLTGAAASLAAPEPAGALVMMLGCALLSAMRRRG